MGKRKGRSSEVSETLNHMKVENDQEEEEVEGSGGFFACYLLTSLSPRFKGHTYIGFTVNPRRRIRQHNGEIRCGAWRTKHKRPWEMVLCIYGFPTNVAALQFEWAWQHPVESLAVRKAAVAFKSLSGLANKIKLVYTMLTLPAWQSLNLSVNFFSTKYTKHSAGCPSLPKQMKVQVCSMDELPCYGGEDWNAYENGELKNVCDDDNDIECDRSGVAYGRIDEELADTTVYNPDDHQNRECADTSHAYNFTDHWTSSEETSSEWIRTIEENQRENPGASDIQRDNNRWPFCLNDSPERGLSSFATSSNSIPKEPVEGRGMFGLTEDCDIELDMDMPTRKQLPNTTDADKSLPTSKSSTIPCEVDVIDVFTPSPSNRISSRRKKMSVSSVFPEIIDLTKSPIFV